MTLTGTLKRKQLGGSTTFVLEAAAGPHELRGSVDASLVGKTVRVTGELAEAQFGFAMSGPILTVERMEATR